MKFLTPPDSVPAPTTDRALFVLVGGFLGAGKTSAIGSLAGHFQAQGKRLGFIANDQGEGLIDSQRMNAAASTKQGNTAKTSRMREITGGCFCCKADALVEALHALAKESHPEVFLAEPVGSCTDLVATVLNPLRAVYKLPLRLAPMSVLLDARRLADLYFGKPGKSVGFSRDVSYIYLKQMEEAEILVVNKVDLLKPTELTKLIKKLKQDWPGKTVLPMSVTSAEGMAPWLELLEGMETTPTRTMSVDYQQYGVGEALLGWYNAELVWKHPKPVDGDEWLLVLAQGIQRALETAGVELAHFKMSLEVAPRTEQKQNARALLAVVSAVRNGSPAEISQRIARKVKQGRVLVNLRAEGAPDILQNAVRNGISKAPGRVVWQNEAAFRPGQPNPVHRVTSD